MSGFRHFSQKGGVIKFVAEGGGGLFYAHGTLRNI